MTLRSWYVSAPKPGSLHRGLRRRQCLVWSVGCGMTVRMPASERVSGGVGAIRKEEGHQPVAGVTERGASMSKRCKMQLRRSD